MFYNSQIMNGNSLKNAWRAGTNQELCTQHVPLPKVCKMLDSWIASDYQDPGRRLSLRTSSILVDGAAKLYKQGLDELIEDVFKMEYQMITRNRRCSEIEPLNSEEFEQSNDNDNSPEQSASVVRCDSFDVNKSGKSKKNNMPNSQLKCGKKKQNEMTQTPETSRQTKISSDVELPIGQIYIYENLASKVPSKIIVGTINSDVRKNIKF